MIHSEPSTQRVWGPPVHFLGYGSHGGDPMLASWMRGTVRIARAHERALPGRLIGHSSLSRSTTRIVKWCKRRSYKPRGRWFDSPLRWEFCPVIREWRQTRPHTQIHRQTLRFVKVSQPRKIMPCFFHQILKEHARHSGVYYFFVAGTHFPTRYGRSKL